MTSCNADLVTIMVAVDALPDASIAVNVTVGGVSSDVLYAGAAPGLVGLDQVNLRLSRSLAGRGEVEVALSADGKAANPVRITIR